MTSKSFKRLQCVEQSVLKFIHISPKIYESFNSGQYKKQDKHKFSHTIWLKYSQTSQYKPITTTMYLNKITISS